jgi:hypothetical protein
VADVSRIYPVPVDYKMPQFPDLKFDYDKDFGREEFLLLLYDIKVSFNCTCIIVYHKALIRILHISFLTTK